MRYREFFSICAGGTLG